jgi:2-dehydro-3-deoxyphosphogluconate aldolase/(4S)-4-hydroxy-2-oxoglutarate aldolase
MTSFSAIEIRLAKARVVPVIVLDNAGDAVPVGQALAAGGLGLIEVTLRTAAGVEAIAAMAGLDGVTVGAGTVLTCEQVDRAADAGAQFVVSPGLSRKVIERCLEREVMPLPGVATATEVQAALDLGLGTVKFFPAGIAGGAAAIKALSGPFPQLKWLPTGGVDLGNLAGYLALKQVVAVGGSWLAPRELVHEGRFDQIRERAEQAVAAATHARPEL